MLGKYAWVAAIAMVTGTIWAAERKKEEQHKDWPTKAAIEKAEDRIKYEKDHAVTIEHRGEKVEFVPCDIGQISDRDRERGMILGKLINEGKSDDKLSPGSWLVFVRKHNDQWEGYFCTKHEPVAKSTEVKWMGDKENRPSFEMHGSTIRYCHLRVAW